MSWLYLAINLVFTLLAATAVFTRLASLQVRAWFTSLLVVGLLTLVFDNVIVGLEIVGYNSAFISGLKLGFAPIEDFGYLLTGSVLIPALWQRFGKVGKSVTQIDQD